MFFRSLTDWAPSPHDSPVVWVGIDGVDDLNQLVHPLTTVVRVHVNVIRSEVTPLEAIHWTKVACSEQLSK